MENFREIKHVVEAASSSGLGREGAREILDGSIFSQSDIGLLGLLKDSLGQSQKRNQLMDILESRTQEPIPLSEVVGVFDKFARLQGQLEGELTEADIGLLRFTIKYFEDWFHRGEWTQIPEAATDKPYLYLSVPAGIINMVTKIKELPQYAEELGGLEASRLSELQNRVRQFAAQLFSEDRLRRILQEQVGGSGAAPIAHRILSSRDAMMRTFNISENSVRHELGPRSHNKAGDLYFLKTCLIAAEMLRRDGSLQDTDVFLPDVAMPTPKNQYVAFDFSNGADPRKNSMHYPTFRLPYCKFVAECLAEQNRK